MSYIRKGWNGFRRRLGFQAQKPVPQAIAEQQIREEIPVSWKQDGMLWGYVTRYMLKGSGMGFVTPPYTAYWERLWGVSPIEDLPKYKDLYFLTSYIKASLDVTINLAISNGFELSGGDEAVREWLTDWLDEHNILETLRILGVEMLVFGSSYAEICHNEDTGEVDHLKPLDPVHVRVRRDAYGNVFGYIQLLTFPPVVFTPNEMIHFRWGAKSAWYENCYGTSLLRPLLKIQALLDQFEDDMAVIMHTYAKPMIITRAGTPENPFSESQLAALDALIMSRHPGTDLTVRGDVEVTALQSLSRGVNLQFWLDYLYKQREAVLGVPKIFLGEMEGANRATAEIVMQEYITRIRMIQEIIGDNLETTLFKQMINQKFGEGVEIPEVVWRPIWEPTTDVKATYIKDIYAQGIITLEEARTELGFSPEPGEGETLPPAQRKLKAILDDSQK